MFREKDEADLRNEILSLKVQLNNAKNENCLLKVKIRKLQDEIAKKNKHIEVLLNPKKSSAFHKVMSENGATIVMNSLERNLKLQKQLDERNAQIKKLQGELETTRLYTTSKKQRPSSVKSNSAIEVGKVKINMPVKSLTFKEKDEVEESNSLTASLEGRCACGAKKDDENRCPRNSGSPESDLDRNELFCETPHKEIQQLHKYVIDVLSEVDTLKETIAQIQGERERPDKVFNEKKEDDLQVNHHRGTKSKPVQRNNNKESNNKKTVIKSPRKIRVKKKAKRKSNNGERADTLQILGSCMDAIETQMQRESSCIDTESESDCNCNV